MSVIEVLHDVRNFSIKKGKKVKDEEYVIQGEKGLKIKYFHKDDKTAEKIVITGKDGVYKMKSTIDGEVTEKDLDEKALEKELKSAKLKFAKEQLKGGAKADSGLVGGRKGSKKGSKKAGSKKGSKKAGSKKSGSKKSGSKK
jgi:hypothetical protein